MNANKSPSTLVVGLAFFSMFFGSGNLIFPLMLGARYENLYFICAMGFVVTAVFLPMLGILVMLPAEGRYEKLFNGLLPNSYARWFFLAVLIFWIPLGSGPRCVVLAHASIDTYFSYTPPLWLFSLIFLTLCYWCVVSRNQIIELLGKFLTPALLLSILCIVISSFRRGDINASSVAASNVFLESLVSGYYTQDLIAAVFFSSALLSMLNMNQSNRDEAIKKTWQGGLIAIFLLAILYTALMAASAIHAEYLQGLSGEKLVSALAHVALGSTFGSVSSVAVSLACITTEIALVLVFADFLRDQIFAGKRNKESILITLGIIWIMSLIKFDGIMAIVAPAMQIIYPVLLVLVLRFLWRSRTQLAK